MLIELVTIGPAAAIIDCPTTIHQKLLFNIENTLIHAPISINPDATLSTFFKDVTLYNKVETMKAGKNTAALMLTAKLTSERAIPNALAIELVKAEIATEDIH